jgi:hypothetical protein
MNILQQIKNLTYRLKHDFGMPITILQVDDPVVDPKTGQQVTEHTRIEIRRAIVGSVTTLFRYARMLSGGQFQFANPRSVDSRLIIIDKADAPSLKEEDHVIIGTQIYDIEKMVEAETNNSFLLLVKQTTGMIVPTESGS